MTTFQETEGKEENRSSNGSSNGKLATLAASFFRAFRVRFSRRFRVSLTPRRSHNALLQRYAAIRILTIRNPRARLGLRVPSEYGKGRSHERHQQRAGPIKGDALYTSAITKIGRAHV